MGISTAAADWERARRLLEEALSLPSSERKHFLDEACPDPELRREVESLLAADRAAGDFLARPALEDHERPPERIGSYRLIEKLGQGGMGAVYLVERADGEFTKRFALKLLRPGFEQADLIARFRTERQILASLDHPGIARLVDGGSDEAGRPFLVMDHVEGLPLLEFCDRAKLGIDGRLELFVKVCEAVAFAHQRLIIHRDLKSANILVGADGLPKVLDFGIAKLLNDSVGPEAAALTAEGPGPMTPECASPEQVRGETLTTATDIYSLGVLLYRLLVGAPPYHLPARTPLEAARVIAEVEPLRPSARFALPNPDFDAESQAVRRGSSVARLARRLRGDLDAVVDKALRKEAGERFASVQQLAADVTNARLGLPVLARRGTWLYRAGKVVRRHAWAFGSAAVVFLTLAGAVVALLTQRAAILREQQRAEQVSQFLIGLFESADPTAAATLDVKQVLARGVERIDRELSADPLLRADLLNTLGEVQINLGEFESSRKLTEKSLELWITELGADHPKVAAGRVNLGELLMILGEYQPAIRHLEAALATWRKAMPDPEPAIFPKTLIELAEALRYSGDFEKPLPLLLEARAYCEKNLSRPHATTANALKELGSLKTERGEHEEAEPILHASLNLYRELYPAAHPMVSEVINQLALLIEERGRLDEAGELFRQGLEMDRALLGDEHPQLASALNNLANNLQKRGRFREALPMFERVLELDRVNLGEEHHYFAVSLGNLADIKTVLEGAAIAEPMKRRVVAIDRKNHKEHINLAASLRTLAEVLIPLGRLVEARALLDESLAMVVKTVGEKHGDHGVTQLTKARLNRLEGRFEESATLIREAQQTLKTALGDHPQLAAADVEAAALALAQGQAPQALERVRAASLRQERQLGANHPLLGRSKALEAEILKSLNLCQEARSTAAAARLLLEQAGARGWLAEVESQLSGC